MKYNSTSFKKIYLLFSLIVLILFLLLTKANSEKKIGTIVTIKNDVYAIDKEGKKRLLDLYDEILLNEEILTNELSSATAQYDDNSTIIIKESSSFKVNEFDISGLKDIFIGIVDKGSVVIESGKIAKKDNGSMVIELPTMRLEIKGTRFNIDNKPDGSSEVSLAEDSFGNVGTINISSEGNLKTLFDPEQVISVNAETGISERPRTEDEKKQLEDISKDLVEASSIDENLIQKKLEEKLLNGKLLDANNDGKIDLSDIDIIRENIKSNKQENIDFIVDNSTNGNTQFLSNVLNDSDAISTGQSMDRIFETKNDLITSVMTNLSNNNNQFIMTSEFDVNNIIKEKIYNQMLADNDVENNNVNLIANIMSKSDASTIEKMIGYVQVSDTNNAGSNFSLQILSSLTDAKLDNSIMFDDDKQNQVNRLIEEAVANTANNEADSMMLANVISKSDVGTIGMLVDNIQMMGQNDQNSNFSLKVLSSVADTKYENSISFGTEEQNQVNRLIEEAVANAANNEADSMMLANVISKSNTDTIAMMVDNIQMMGQNDQNSNFSLKVLSSVADTKYENSISFGTEEQNQVNRLIEEAVANAANNEADSMMLANVISKSNTDTIAMMVDNIQMKDYQNSLNKGIDDNSSYNLSLQVLSSVADTKYENSISFGTEDQTQVNRLIEDAINNSGNNTTDTMMLANVIMKSDAVMMDAMFSGIAANSGNSSNPDLGLNVLSSMATTASANPESFNTLQKDNVNKFITTTYSSDAPETDEDSNPAETDEDSNPAETDEDSAPETDEDSNPAETDEDSAPETEDDAVTYDENGFNIAAPYHHQNTDSIYDTANYDKDGFNQQGYNSQSVYNPFYNRSASPA